MAHSAVSSGALTQPLMRGWLQKRSRHMKQWRKRWVILQEFGIYTFKTDTNVISAATEVIDLHTVIYVRAYSDVHTESKSDLSYCFEIYCNNVTFIFNAESTDGMNKWMKCIGRQLFKTYLIANNSNEWMDHNNATKQLWVCANCAYQNALNYKTCTLCGNNKTNQARIVSPCQNKKRDSVNLADIVMNNNVMSDEDTKEEKKEEKKEDRMKRNIQKRWQCKICTYENIETLPFCEVCRTQRPQRAKKKKEKLNIINLSAEQLNKQCKNNKCTFKYIKCPCINRIISILIFYQKWLMNKNGNNSGSNEIENLSNQQAFDLAVYQKQIYDNNGPLLRLTKASNIKHKLTASIYDFINEILENYSSILLLNDFNHILAYHCNQHREIEEITKNIMSKFINNNSQCSLTNCFCLRRNHRNKSNQNRNELYFSDESNEIVTQQILDKIHCRLLHSFQLYQFRDSEYQLIRNTHSLNSNNILHLNHNRLKTIKDIMKSKQKNLLLLRGNDRIKNSKFTTQISSQPKILRRQSLLDQQLFDNDKKQNNQPEDDDIAMEFGKRCFYWKFYGSKKWYIFKKYENLKEELLNNKFQCISLIEYSDLYTKCMFLSKCLAVKQLATKEKNIANFKYYELNKDELFKMDHIMAMLLYCNNDILCNVFLKTFSFIDTVMSMEEFKKQHREFANWARLMREIGECFGNEYENVKNNKNNQRLSFYHGISSQQLLFGETIRFNMPKSCTNKLSVALQYVSEDEHDGLILEIEKNNEINDCIYYFDKKQCEIFSDFPAEIESIFVGGHQSLKLKSILNVIQCENYKVYLSAINYFQQLIIGHYPINQKLTKSTIYAFNNLIKNEIRADEDDMKSHKSMVPQYISNLFHFIALKTNHKITLKIDDIEKYFDKSIKNLFINHNNSWCKLEVLISLFPNVEKIWIEKLQIEETTMIQLYTFCERISERNKTKTIKYAPQFLKLNEIIFIDVKFKIDLNDQNYLNQIQKPFQQITWNISLDFHHQYSKGIRLWK